MTRDPSAAHAPSPLTLFYEQPAREAITEGLPLGNGVLGALVLGAPERERLVLNEATLWAAGPYDATNPDAKAALPEVRRLIFEGQYRHASVLAEEKLMGRPKYQPPFQPLGDLFIELAGHEAASNYRRELDLDTAIARTRYDLHGLSFTREFFVSAADSVLVARFEVSQPGALTARLRLESEQRGMHEWQRGVERWQSRTEFGMRGRNLAALGIDGALLFEFAARIRASGGRAMPGEEGVSLRNVDSFVLVATAASNYLSFQDLSGDPRAIVQARLEKVEGLSYAELRERHLSDYQPRFRRLSIDFGGADASSERPTDARVASFEDGADPKLAALYVQYARYLLLACSRPGSQPANLQGLWNDKLHPPWGCKCTININTEMNYWPAEPAALPECTEPLLALLRDLAESGQRTAREHYGARGWVAHHNVDLWRATAPVDGAEWGLWPMGGAWLCLHLWEHYEYTLDRAYLAEAYPILKGACEFFLDTLLPHPESGYLVTCPSMSPENQHPFGSTLCAGPTVDNAILRDLFSATIESAKELGLDAALRDELASARARLAPYRVGRGGQLQEWLADWDLEVPEPHHRHVSHLFGLHPSQQISVEATPELAAAARRTLELRGDAATGWSLAWKVNLWARLLEGERAYELLRLLLSPERTYTNLFDAHPPFQIDGNFGGAAGILEMLLQSRRGALHLLPALPKALHTGVLRGAKARGGLSVDLEWSQGTLDQARIVSSIDQQILVRVGARSAISLSLKAGEPASVPASST